MSDELGIFQDDLIEDSLTIINVDEINNDATIVAQQMIDNLSQFYYDEEFMKAHPQIRKRINDELETMRILLKMRKADEEAHDALIKAISANNNNASLYKALTNIQNSILSITTKMSEIVDRLNNMMKGFQLELQFEKSEEGDDEELDKNIHRGTKEFIKQMVCD